MRFCAVFILGVVLLAAWSTGPARAAETSAAPSVDELQAQIAATAALVEQLQQQLGDMQFRLEQLESAEGRPAPEQKEEGLSELRAAAEATAEAEMVPPESREEPTFASGALGLQALNPEISVTGDFITSYRSGDAVTQPLDNTLRTLGLHFESYLDPYSRFKAAVPVTDDKAALGEAYFTRYDWLPDLNVTVGKLRQQFGIVNRWHKHALDQVDFPLPLRQIFGPGGLNQTGASLDWQLPPLGNASQELTFQVTNGENPRVFGENSRNTPSFLAHYRNYRDLNKDTYLEWGLSGLAGRNNAWGVLDPDEEMLAQQRKLWTSVLGADLTLMWEPTERMRYRNWVWRTEAYLLNKKILAPDGSGEDTLHSWGAYSYFQKKLDRTREVGVRVDYYEPDVKDYADLPGLSLAPLAVTAPGAHQWLFAPYVTWYQSPWVHWRLEYDRLLNHDMGPDENVLYLQCVFAAGPHKHERY
jgi:hypothetical protein